MVSNPYQAQKGYVTPDNSFPPQPFLQSTPPKTPTQVYQVGGAEQFESPSVQGAMRNRSMGSKSPYAGFNPALNKSSWLKGICKGAELTVLGDPQCANINDQIQVNDYYPITYKNLQSALVPHYSSGVYRITKIVHSMAVGSVYLTKFDLDRMA
jgi:hypothetical protein